MGTPLFDSAANAVYHHPKTRRYQCHRTIKQDNIETYRQSCTELLAEADQGAESETSERGRERDVTGTVCEGIKKIAIHVEELRSGGEGWVDFLCGSRRC